MVGLNGSGKTTTSAKLAGLLKKQGKKPLLVAGDIYRPAAITQLGVVAKNAGVTIRMSNKVYDVLKLVATTILPAISALYIGLSHIWGFGFGEQVDETIQLIIVTINAILGLAVIKSSSDYKKNGS